MAIVAPPGAPALSIGAGRSALAIPLLEPVTIDPDCVPPDYVRVLDRPPGYATIVLGADPAIPATDEQLAVVEDLFAASTVADWDGLPRWSPLGGGWGTNAPTSWTPTDPEETDVSLRNAGRLARAIGTAVFIDLHHGPAERWVFDGAKQSPDPREVRRLRNDGRRALAALGAGPWCLSTDEHMVRQSDTYYPGYLPPHWHTEAYGDHYWGPIDKWVVDGWQRQQDAVDQATNALRPAKGERLSVREFQRKIGGSVLRPRAPLSLEEQEEYDVSIYMAATPEARKILYAVISEAARKKVPPPGGAP